MSSRRLASTASVSLMTKPSQMRISVRDRQSPGSGQLQNQRSAILNKAFRCINEVRYTFATPALPIKWIYATQSSAKAQLEFTGINWDSFVSRGRRNSSYLPGGG